MDLVAGLVALNGGEIVGKTRLQKTVFLLEYCGLNSGLEFTYALFGPFSSDLAEAADDAVAMGVIQSEDKPGYHQVPYTIYRTQEVSPQKLGDLSRDKGQRILRTLDQFSAVELELAATLIYLGGDQKREQAELDTRQLKPLKATDQRIKRAWDLVEKLDAIRQG
jgi:uncharacterized protein YwgA